ncbi:VC0807 family protein [Kutzneria albida]|uniref:Uncharacterized protein n=1 Tax=Kutzneria albida DSM 43870 TaxID=1449976 RepID=W5WBP1_9PSEU|nr:VC0807 family protein [Kutzneria albida]AHH95614.1 hypothetical protein KALB_2245 [Kutzneria albida DSM 43870]
MTDKLRTVLPMVLDVVLPIGGYYLLHAFGVGDFWALTIAGLATAANALVNTVRRGRLDTLGVLVLVMLGLSIALIFVTGDPRFLLAKGNVYVTLAGLYVLGTTVFGRPLSYLGAKPMATRGDPLRELAYERVWHNRAPFRRAHRVLSAVWGLAMLGNAAGSLAIIYSHSVAEVSESVLLSQAPGIAMLAIMVVSVRFTRPRLRTLVDAEHAALTHESRPTDAESRPGARESR